MLSAVSWHVLAQSLSRKMRNSKLPASCQEIAKCVFLRSTLHLHLGTLGEDKANTRQSYFFLSEDQFYLVKGLTWDGGGGGPAGAAAGACGVNTEGPWVWPWPP